MLFKLGLMSWWLSDFANLMFSLLCGVSKICNLRAFTHNNENEKIQIWRRNKLLVQAVALPSMLLIKIHVMSIKLGDIMKFLSQFSSEKLSQYSINYGHKISILVNKKTFLRA